MPLILALLDLVLRKSSGPVHMREFNVESLGVNAILIVTETALSYPYFMLCFPAVIQYISVILHRKYY